MVIGCVIANLFSTVGGLDIAVGSFATLLACLITWAMSRGLETKRWKIWLVPLPTIVSNAVIVGALIAYYMAAEGSDSFLPAWGFNALTVGAGEAAVMYALGVPLLFWLLRSGRVANQLRLV